MGKPLFIARQSRRPSGLFGQIVARIMPFVTARDNARTLEFLELAGKDRVLEVGCGHGRTLTLAAARAEGIAATGVDFSEVMIDVARRRNADLIEAGRVRIDLADAAKLPYDDDAFTKAYSVHTIYFWSEIDAHLSEILRVMAPGGRLVLGFHPSDDPKVRAELPAAVYRLRTLAEVEAAIERCGFVDVSTASSRIGKLLMAWLVAHKAAL